MLEIKIKFKPDGTYDNLTYPNIVQGDNDTVKLTVSFLQAEATGTSLPVYYDLSKFVVTVVAERPDGVVSPQLIMMSDFLDTKIATLYITNWITQVSGNVKVTVSIKQEQDDGTFLIKNSGIFYLPIQAAVISADQAITNAQLDSFENEILNLRNQIKSGSSVLTLEDVGYAEVTTDFVPEDFINYCTNFPNGTRIVVNNVQLEAYPKLYNFAVTELNFTGTDDSYILEIYNIDNKPLYVVRFKKNNTGYKYEYYQDGKWSLVYPNDEVVVSSTEPANKKALWLETGEH